MEMRCVFVETRTGCLHLGRATDSGGWDRCKLDLNVMLCAEWKRMSWYAATLVLSSLGDSFSLYLVYNLLIPSVVLSFVPFFLLGLCSSFQTLASLVSDPFRFILFTLERWLCFCLFHLFILIPFTERHVFSFFSLSPWLFNDSFIVLSKTSSYFLISANFRTLFNRRCQGL